jgi:hypothetical protein
MPKQNPIDSIQVHYVSEFKGWIIYLFGKEIGGGINYYLKFLRSETL